MHIFNLRSEFKQSETPENSGSNEAALTCSKKAEKPRLLLPLMCDEYTNLRTDNMRGDRSSLIKIIPTHKNEGIDSQRSVSNAVDQNPAKSVSFADAHGQPLNHIKHTDEFNTQQQYQLKTNYGCRLYPPGPVGRNVPARKIKKTVDQSPLLTPRRDGRSHREAAAISYKQVNSFSERGAIKASQQLREIRRTIPLQQTEYLSTGKITSNYGYGHEDSVPHNRTANGGSIWRKFFRI
jgi:hypothetical protein